MAKKKAKAAPAPASSSQAAASSSQAPVKLAAKAHGVLDDKPAGRRQLDRRDTDEQAERALKKHCAGSSDARVSSTVDDEGHSAKETLKNDIRAMRARGGRLSSVYYRRFGARFGFAQAQVVVVVVKSADEKVGDNLHHAMQMCVKK